MSTLTVQIVFHGLIALMPINDDPGGANHMRALLVEARHLPANIQEGQVKCFVPHKPVLAFFTNPEDCLALHCKATSFRCTCDLDRKELVLQVNPSFEPTRQHLSTAAASNLPFDSDTAGDFGYLANLTTVSPGLTIDPAVLAPDPPASLVARMEFPFSSVTACRLAWRRDEGSNNVYPLSFRKLGDLESSGDMNQAVAQMVISRLEIPYPGTTPPEVKLGIGDFNATPQWLTLRPAGSKVEIELMNSPEKELDYDDPCDDGVARHFAFFYQIMQNAPVWAERPVPHVKYTQWKSAKDLESEHCDPTKDPMSRPICPMGSINP